MAGWRFRDATEVGLAEAPDGDAALWPAGSPDLWPDPPMPGVARAARWGAALLDLIYPPTCLTCSHATATPHGLCAGCWSRMGFITAPVCERLGTPLPFDLGPGLVSPEAIADPPAYGRARAVARFADGPAQVLAHRLKYGDRPDHARMMGRWMAQAGATLLAEADVVVPIPLHGRRLWARRFNQAAELARAVARSGGKPVDLDGLVRRKATRSQVGLSRAERAANLQGAFRIAEGAAGRFKGRRALLVDDVLTTGATCNAAARALLRDGAAAVDVVVFARVVTGTWQ